MQDVDTLHLIFRERVRGRLDELGMSQVDLAHEMGVSEAYISEIVNGKNVPGLSLVDRIAKALKMKGTELLSG